MTDGEALLAAILASPSEDTPRLAYADWLEENGQPERAEFIRVQCELARELEPELKTIGPLVFPDYADQLGGRCARCMKLKKTCRYHELERRERELFKKNAAKWRWDEIGRFGHILYATFFEPVPADAVDGRFVYRRGFPYSFTCTAADWLQHADAILKQQPVEKVTLTTMVDRLEPIFEQIEKVSPDWQPPEPNPTRFSGWEESGGSMQMKDLLSVAWPGIEFELPAARRGMERATLTEEGRRQRLVEARIEVRRNVALGRMTEEEGRRAIAHLEAEVPVA